MFDTSTLMDDDLPFVRREIIATRQRRHLEVDIMFREHIVRDKSLAEIALCCEIECGLRPATSYKEMMWYSVDRPKNRR